tara:strand:+ start:233 stop:481 length:249 start_codon:yes stop_codon:yes gene_type:complete
MSKIPDTVKTKYNHNDPFRWVDSQWEKFMTEQRENKAHIKQLQKDLVTCNRHFQERREELLRLQIENTKLKDRLKNLGEYDG